MSAQNNEGAGDTAAAIAPERCEVRRHLMCPWDSVSPWGGSALATHEPCFLGCRLVEVQEFFAVKLKSSCSNRNGLISWTQERVAFYRDPCLWVP